MDWLPPLIDEMGRAPTVIWASPECKFFSLAYNAPRVVAERNNVDYNPDMSQAQAVFDIVEYCKDEYGMPKYWCVENVNGSQGYFLPYFGRSKQRFNAIILYGNYPNLHLPNFKHSKYDGDLHSSHPMRYNKRSLIPIEVSEAFLDAVHTQTTLGQWI